MADDEGGSVLPMFTRGGPEVPQQRGKSMVEKHLERQQAERQAACLVRSLVTDTAPHPWRSL